VLQRRSYHAGALNRLTNDWQPSTVTADKAISDQIQTIRDRARQLERDNRYVSRWLSALENNVLGADGINFQSKVREKSGKFDKGANVKIEEAWTDWTKPQNCSLSREDSWIDLQKLILRSTARDGGVLIQIKRGRDLNAHGIALNLLEIDMLDVRYTEVLTNGNEVRLGVERNNMGQVVAFHLLQTHPGDFMGYPMPMNNRDRVRVPAFGTNPAGDEILHYYVKSRIMQSVGVPWLTPAMRDLHHLDEYQHAELLQSRAAAAKGGWFENERGEQWSGDREQSTDEDGNTEETQHLMDFDQAAYEELPPGVKFVPWDPQHPNNAFEAYIRANLHGVSAGLDIDYATLTGDLSQNSFSSTKAGRLEIQEQWKKVQGHLITNACVQIFGSWLAMSMLTRKLALPTAKYDQMNRPLFKGRRWPWVDPVKDMQAASQALESKLRSKSDIIAENGGDYEDTMEQLAFEKETEKELGLADAEPKKPQAIAPPDEDEDEQDTDSDDGNGEVKPKPSKPEDDATPPTKKPPKKPAQQTEEDKASQIFGYHIQMAIVKINESRAALGLPPVEYGDQTFPEYAAALKPDNGNGKPPKEDE
jgi:lambda family phage portal protein